MSEMIERVAFATCSSSPCICRNRAGFEGMPCLDRGRAAIMVFGNDPDIQEALRWLDFKSCGWHPDEQVYRGAHKLLTALKPDYIPSVNAPKACA